MRPPTPSTSAPATPGRCWTTCSPSADGTSSSGGPTVAAAFLRAGLVDEVVAYLAPVLLGAGRSAVGDLGITTIADALHLDVGDVTVLDPAAPGDDLNVRLTMTRKGT